MGEKRREVRVLQGWTFSAMDNPIMKWLDILVLKNENVLHTIMGKNFTIATLKRTGEKYFCLFQQSGQIWYDLYKKLCMKSGHSVHIHL